MFFLMQTPVPAQTKVFEQRRREAGVTGSSRERWWRGMERNSLQVSLVVQKSLLALAFMGS